MHTHTFDEWIDRDLHDLRNTCKNGNEFNNDTNNTNRYQFDAINVNMIGDFITVKILFNYLKKIWHLEVLLSSTNLKLGIPL